MSVLKSSIDVRSRSSAGTPESWRPGRRPAGEGGARTAWRGREVRAGTWSVGNSCRGAVRHLLDVGSPFLELSSSPGGALRRRGPRRRDHHRDRQGLRPGVHGRRQRRHRKGVRTSPHGQEAPPARRSPRPTTSLHLPRGFRRGQPAPAGRGLPDGTISQDLLQPGGHVLERIRRSRW